MEENTLTESESLSEVVAAPVGAHVTRPDTSIEASEGWYRVTTPSAKTDSLNEVLYSVLADAEAERVVDETVADYRRLRVPFKWIVGLRSAPGTLADLLAARGLDPWEAWGMIGGSTLPVDAPAGISVEEVNGDRLAEYCRILSEGWNVDLDQALADHRRLLERPSRRHRWFLAFHDGEPAGAAGHVLHPASAYLVGAVVLPRFRGRGVYRALTRARLRDVRRRGIATVTTHARARTSGPILERLGFRRVLTYEIYAPPEPSRAG